MTPAGPALIWCPFPDSDSALAAANSLLDERLVACANMLPVMRSLIDWQGRRAEALETGVILKTDAALLDKAIARLSELHPYDEPAVLGWRCDEANQATRAWLGALAK